MREGHEDDDVDDDNDDDDGEDDLRFLAACQGEMDGALTHTSPCPLLIPHKHKHKHKHKLKDKHKHKHLQSLKGECKSPHPKSYKCRDKYFILGQYGFATEVIRL